MVDEPAALVNAAGGANPSDGCAAAVQRGDARRQRMNQAPR